MSRASTGRNPDLRRLRDEGYSLSVARGRLVVTGIPFVSGPGRIERGTLIVPLDMVEGTTARPTGRDVFWVGAVPCDDRGVPIDDPITSPLRRDFGGGLVANHLLHAKPDDGGFEDYHQLVSSYVGLICRHAISLDPTVTARGRRRVVVTENPQGPFDYADTASQRTGIGAFSGKLEGSSVAIVGLGGTGAYVLDLVAKTPVARIHLFDDETLHQHDAFLSPGAASFAEIGAAPARVDHYAALYSRVHRGVVPHRSGLLVASLAMLDQVDFAFLCIDGTAAKRPVIEHLERTGKRFVDLGMKLRLTPTGVSGTVRITTSTPAMRSHVRDMNRIPFPTDSRGDDDACNLQVAELNALNAALAVIRWKKLYGFYADPLGEHHAVYSVDGNQVLNTDSDGAAGTRCGPS